MKIIERKPHTFVLKVAMFHLPGVMGESPFHGKRAEKVSEK